MYFDSFAEFIAMDGHGVFVWSAYGVTLLVVGAYLVNQRRARRRIEQQIRSRIRREQINQEK